MTYIIKRAIPAAALLALILCAPQASAQSANTSLSNVPAATRSSTTVPYSADFFNLGDAGILTNDVHVTALPSGVRSKAYASSVINVVDPGGGTASSENTAAFALALNASGPNFTTDTTAGELDALPINVRQGVGDSDAITINMQGRYGAVSMLEGINSSVDSSAAPLKSVGVNMGAINTRDGGEAGLILSAAKGILGAGLWVANSAAGSFTYPMVYSTPTNPFLWAVVADGSMVGPHGPVSLGTKAWTPTLTPNAGTASYALNRAWYSTNGDQVSFGIDVTFNVTSGTAHAGLNVPLPVAASGTPAGSCSGREVALTGYLIGGGILPSGLLNITTFNNDGAIANGARYVFSCTYASS